MLTFACLMVHVLWIVDVVCLPSTLVSLTYPGLTMPHKASRWTSYSRLNHLIIARQHCTIYDIDKYNNTTQPNHPTQSHPTQKVKKTSSLPRQPPNTPKQRAFQSHLTPPNPLLTLRLHLQHSQPTLRVHRCRRSSVGITLRMLYVDVVEPGPRRGLTSLRRHHVSILGHIRSCLGFVEPVGCFPLLIHILLVL